VALDKPTHMAASVDLRGTANLLIDTGLARAEERIVTARDLRRLDSVADLNTLKGIARLLLTRRPPDWLRTVVAEGKVALELIPKQDLDSLSWLGDDLETIIVAANRHLYGDEDEHRRKLLGDAGELAVMSALRSRGLDPRHVALVSDRFGYDVELQVGNVIYGYEVKAAVTTTAQRILLSRNEFNVAAAMNARWCLLQVTFSTRVFALGRATANDVIEIREMTSNSIQSMAPSEPASFRWTEAAEFRPKLADWKASDLVVGSDFVASLELATRTQD